MSAVSRRALLLSGLALSVAGCFPTGPQTAAPGETPIPGPDATVSPATPTIDAGEVDFPAGTTNPRDRIIAYRARPRGRGPFPAILIAPDSRGLADFPKDVARRLAVIGYVGLGVDYLWRLGGTDTVGDGSAAARATERLRPDQAVQDTVTALRYLQELDFVRRDAIGLLGFDWGASIGWQTVLQSDIPRAAVLYALANPDVSRLDRLTAPLLAIYPDERRLTDGVERFNDALRRANKSVEIVIAPNTSRGFENTTAQGFQLEAARTTWRRTVSFFDTTLRR